MQNLLQISPATVANNGSATITSTNSASNQSVAPVSSEFNQVLETSINDVQNKLNPPVNHAVDKLNLSQSSLSLQQLKDLKSMLARIEGKEFAEIDGLQSLEGGKLPDLNNIIAGLEDLINQFASIQVEGGAMLSSGQVSDLESLDLNNGQLNSDLISELEHVIAQIEGFIGAQSGLGSENDPVMDEISAAINALSAGLNSSVNSKVAQAQSVNSSSVVDPAAVQDQSIKTSISDLSPANSNINSNLSGGAGGSNDGSYNGGASEKLFDVGSQKIAVSEGLKDIEMSFAEQIKIASNKQSVTEVQSRLVGGTDRLYATTVPTNVFEPEWGDDMSQKIVWMTSREIKSAEIHLNPAELGPIDVKVSVQSDNATVNINAQNATVREMLESQVVRLRELMEQNGINLDDVNVGAGEQEQMAQQDGKSSNDGSAGDADNSLAETGDDDSNVVVEATSTPNLVDFYA